MSRTPHSPLEGVAPLAVRSRGARAALETNTDVLRPAPGTILAREGSLAREVLVVVAGEVRVRRGRRECTPVGPGETIGGSEVLAGDAHATTAVAGPGVELRVVAAPAFRLAAPEMPNG